MSMTDNRENYFDDYTCLKGKTLKEIADLQYWFSNGVSVFVLENENDDTGHEIGTELSVGMILKEHPYLASCEVKYENDFYGIKVLRVAIPTYLIKKEKIDKGKVIEGLRHHLHPDRTTKDGETWTEHCFHCPYYNNADCVKALLTDCEKLILEGDKK